MFTSEWVDAGRDCLREGRADRSQAVTRVSEKGGTPLPLHCTFGFPQQSEVTLHVPPTPEQPPKI